MPTVNATDKLIQVGKIWSETTRAKLMPIFNTFK